jgi:formamidopyrimidine-DNA glycosylase
LPELPEVETIVRELAPRLEGRHITGVEILHQRIVRFSECDPTAFLPGRRIRRVTRHGKFILIELDAGWITMHLGMTGQLLFDAPPGKHTRAVFLLDDAVLLYNDSRMFGSIECGSVPARISRLGPDAFTSGDWPIEAFRRRAPIKAVLLNQSVFAGMGNIYTDEALFRAGIHPRRLACRISAERLRRLIDVSRALLAEAVELRGSSVSDYVDASGRAGSFQLRHQVYGREGQPCVQCGTPIRRIVVAQRGTHYCPLCQR